ncbi:uncharacterized protein [Miscanthus floridulus]|uniref:uncharacterized protein n=1 Tax=Miscanthus floridulus TaxID=154761 RepID=UPI0034588D4B
MAANMAAAERPSWFRDGMDPISSYNLEFRIISENMRGGKWYGMSEVVDADHANYRNVVESIVDKCPSPKPAESKTESDSPKPAESKIESDASSGSDDEFDPEIDPDEADEMMALATHAAIKENRYFIQKSDTGRYRVYCLWRNEGCPWRIHASTMRDGKTIQVKKNPSIHECQSQKRTGVPVGCTKYWEKERVIDWLKEDGTLGTTELIKKLKDHFKVEMPYMRVYYGKNLAMDKLYGPWDKSFDNLYRFKAQIESVIDSETNENWVWFMERLKEAIGTPRWSLHKHKLWTCSDAWASYSWSEYWFDIHYNAMAKAKPEAMKYLLQTHKKLWTRSQYLFDSKVDYVTNNLAESFNKWIKKDKGKHLDDLLDTFRQKLLIKWNMRKKVANKFEGKILPHIVKKLREDSYNLDIDVITESDGVAEVCAKGSSDNAFRFVVNLRQRTCVCRVWQGTGLPCRHAIAYITSIPGAKLEDYVDNCYSVEKFRAAYGGVIPSILDKSMWSKATHGFFMHPPLLKSTAGRSKNRHKGALEGGSRKKIKRHECPICHQLGHHWYTCKMVIQ